MWCSDCRQDVAGIASTDEVNAIVCARCGTQLSHSHATETSQPNFSGAPKTGHPAWHHDMRADAGMPVIDLDDWQLDEDLRTAERLASKPPMPKSGVAGQQMGLGATATSLDDVATWQAHPRHHAHELVHPHRTRQSSPPNRGWVAWTFLSLGIMTFVCGAVLSGLSFVAGHGELWTVGLPLVLSGQAGLLLGLVFQLDGLSQTNRENSETLDDLDSRLSDLKQTTSLLSTTHNSAARSFYAHMADGASPQLLLADLKGQLDMLAVKMSQER